MDNAKLKRKYSEMEDSRDAQASNRVPRTPSSEETEDAIPVILIELVPDGNLMVIVVQVQHSNYIDTTLNKLGMCAPIVAKSQEFPRELQIRVSHSHMKLISKPFYVFFPPESAKEILSNGCIAYRDEEDSAEAMLMLLLAIFGKPRLVDLQPEFGTLKAACIVIDKYMLQEPLSLLMYAWGHEFNDPAMVELAEDHEWENEGDWLWLAYFSKAQTMFDSALSHYICYGENPLAMLGLPFPDRLLEQVNSARMTCLQAVRDGASGLVEELSKQSEDPTGHDAEAKQMLWVKLVSSPAYGVSDCTILDSIAKRGLRASLCDLQAITKSFSIRYDITLYGKHSGEGAWYWLKQFKGKAKAVTASIEDTIRNVVAEFPRLENA